MEIHSPTVLAGQHRAAELDRLGDEIAELPTSTRPPRACSI